MRKFAAGFVAVILCFALAAAAQAQDRYERPVRYRDGGPPPASYGAPPPPPRHAVHGEPYFFGHVGFFEPNDSSEGLQGYDSGGSFDFGMGSRVSPALAIEGSIGGFGADRGDNEVTVVPVTFGVRLIIPHPVFEPYVGAGIGAYFADLTEPINGIDDSDTTVGGYASFGVDAWLNPRLALNFEGKYHWAEPEFSGIFGNPVDVKVGGWTIGMGVRVSF